MYLCYTLAVLLGTILNAKNVVPDLEWSNTFMGYGTIQVGYFVQAVGEGVGVAWVENVEH